MSLDTFCRRAFSDAELQRRLLTCDDAGDLVARVIATTASCGLEVRADAVIEALSGAPAWFGTAIEPAVLDAQPPSGWLPISAGWLEGRLHIQWAFFGAESLNAPRFEDDVRRALGRPFNRLFCRYATPIERLLEREKTYSGRAPDGLIFHMSRCGSTWVARMLAALDRAVVLSEADPIDMVVQARHARTNLTPEEQARWLRAMTGALATPRAGEDCCFIKLDSWHVRSAPLFRRAFPDTQWIFLYRDPTEVLVSHAARPGAQMFPDLAGPRVRRFDDKYPIASAEHYARILADFCEAALTQYSAGGGLLVNYQELPDALWTRILPHFGATVSETERTSMMEAGRYNAKAPDRLFAGDSETKRLSATPEILAAAEKWLAPLYQQLEARRTASLTASVR